MCDEIDVPPDVLESMKKFPECAMTIYANYMATLPEDDDEQ